MDRITKRLSPPVLEKDTYTLDALQGVADYAPTKPELSTPELVALQQAMQAARRVETQKEGELKTARDAAVKAEQAFHDAILAARDQVRAQFGADSNEYQSIGMKKKSEYKKPVKKSATAL